MGCSGGKEDKKHDHVEQPPAGGESAAAAESPEEKKKTRADKSKTKKSKPQFRVDKDGKFLRPTAETLQEYFDKYDLDASGSMNSHDEIRQLTTNLLVSALKIRQFKKDDIAAEIAKLAEDTNYPIEQYSEWFFKTFKFGAQRLDEVPEESALQRSSQTLEAEIEESFCELVEDWAGAGQRAQNAIHKAYKFLGDEKFKETVNEKFTSEGDEPLQYAQFEDALVELMKGLLKDTAELAEDDKAVEVSKADLKGWFDLVDTDKSGTIGKGEFAEVIAHFCLNYKCKSAAQILAAVSEKPHFTDYEGAPFRMGGNCRVNNGFELCSGKYNEEGHFLCTHAFDADQGEIFVKVEYQAMQRSGKEDEDHIGEGICIYLADPSVKGWNTAFDGSGPVGFQGKPGGVVGVFLDFAGNISGKGKNHICVKSCDENAPVLAAVKIEESLMTEPGAWQRLQIKFDTQEHKCDVSIKLNGEWKKVIDDLKFDGIEIPKKVCPGVCGATSSENHGCFRVNKLKVEMKPDDD